MLAQIRQEYIEMQKLYWGITTARKESGGPSVSGTDLANSLPVQRGAPGQQWLLRGVPHWAELARLLMSALLNQSLSLAIPRAV